MIFVLCVPKKKFIFEYWQFSCNMSIIFSPKNLLIKWGLFLHQVTYHIWENMMSYWKQRRKEYASIYLLCIGPKHRNRFNVSRCISRSKSSYLFSTALPSHDCSFLLSEVLHSYAPAWRHLGSERRCFVL